MLVLVLRSTRWYDVLFVRRLRNEEASRRWSSDTKRVGLLWHLRWWLRQAAGEERTFIACLGIKRVGYVRCGKKVDGIRDMSIAVHPARRGVGIGQKSILLAIDETSGDSELKGWRARIHPDNSASLSAFSALGFELVQQSDSDEEFLVAERLKNPSLG